MKIRKLFRFNGQHIVRNCSSDRCKKSIHSHTYTVEVFFEADGLDNGNMVLDFGLTKGTIKEFISYFDESFSIWNKEDRVFLDFIKFTKDRVVVMPCSPSAESYSLMFLYVIDKIMKNTKFNNNEKNPRVTSVKVHETKTGYAESFIKDLKLIDYNLDDIVISSMINTNAFDRLKNEQLFINPKPIQQIFIEENLC